ncbi:hypothetical protein Hanom_Chr01g00074691 [Helianthus anomalus]
MAATEVAKTKTNLRFQYNGTIKFPIRIQRLQQHKSKTPFRNKDPLGFHNSNTVKVPILNLDL